MPEPAHAVYLSCSMLTSPVVHSTISLSCFRDTTFTLFLNKKDLFETMTLEQVRHCWMVLAVGSALVSRLDCHAGVGAAVSRAHRFMDALNRMSTPLP